MLAESAVRRKIVSSFAHFFNIGSITDSPDAIVVEQQAFQSREEGEVVDLTHFVVGEVDGVKLVKRGAEVFDQRDLVT